LRGDECAQCRPVFVDHDSDLALGDALEELLEVLADLSRLHFLNHWLLFGHPPSRRTEPTPHYRTDVCDARAYATLVESNCAKETLGFSLARATALCRGCAFSSQCPLAPFPTTCGPPHSQRRFSTSLLRIARLCGLFRPNPRP